MGQCINYTLIYVSSPIMSKKAEMCCNKYVLIINAIVYTCISYISAHYP
jgi:hypothetical protein